MRYSSVNRGFPAGNPLANVLVIVVGTLVVVASVLLGFFVFVILGSALLIAAAFFGIRLWWYRYRMQNSARYGVPGKQAGDGRHETIEGEYRVIADHHDPGPRGTP